MSSSRDSPVPAMMASSPAKGEEGRQGGGAAQVGSASACGCVQPLRAAEPAEPPAYPPSMSSAFMPSGSAVARRSSSGPTEMRMRPNAASESQKGASTGGKGAAA